MVQELGVKSINRKANNRYIYKDRGKTRVVVVFVLPVPALSVVAPVPTPQGPPASKPPSKPSRK